MSLQTHLAELELRHKALESELAEAQQHQRPRRGDWDQPQLGLHDGGQRALGADDEPGEVQLQIGRAHV